VPLHFKKLDFSNGYIFTHFLFLQYFAENVPPQKNININKIIDLDD